MAPACRCGCVDARGRRTHGIVEALAVGDLDAAIDRGLLAIDPCAACSNACREAVLAARDARRFALAARDRFVARQARLARRERERVARRASPPVGTGSAPPLPPAAAAALARARARASGQKDP